MSRMGPKEAAARANMESCEEAWSSFQRVFLHKLRVGEVENLKRQEAFVDMDITNSKNPMVSMAPAFITQDENEGESELRAFVPVRPNEPDLKRASARKMRVLLDSASRGSRDHSIAARRVNDRILEVQEDETARKELLDRVEGINKRRTRGRRGKGDAFRVHRKLLKRMASNQGKQRTPTKRQRDREKHTKVRERRILAEASREARLKAAIAAKDKAKETRERQRGMLLAVVLASRCGRFWGGLQDTKRRQLLDQLHMQERADSKSAQQQRDETSLLLRRASLNVIDRDTERGEAEGNRVSSDMHDTQEHGSSNAEATEESSENRARTMRSVLLVTRALQGYVRFQKWRKAGSVLSKFIVQASRLRMRQAARQFYRAVVCLQRYWRSYQRVSAARCALLGLIWDEVEADMIFDRKSELKKEQDNQTEIASPSRRRAGMAWMHVDTLRAANRRVSERTRHATITRMLQRIRTAHKLLHGLLPSANERGFNVASFSAKADPVGVRRDLNSNVLPIHDLEGDDLHAVDVASGWDQLEAMYGLDSYTPSTAHNPEDMKHQNDDASRQTGKESSKEVNRGPGVRLRRDAWQQRGSASPESPHRSALLDSTLRMHMLGWLAYPQMVEWVQEAQIADGVPDAFLVPSSSVHRRRASRLHGLLFGRHARQAGEKRLELELPWDSAFRDQEEHQVRKSRKKEANERHGLLCLGALYEDTDAVSLPSSDSDKSRDASLF